MDQAFEAGAIIGEAPVPSSGHINKRALRNKSLSLSFNEKDLKDYVGGFHKRKKKRRKEAQKQLEEKERRWRLDQRKRRKEEKEYVLYGGAPPQKDAAPNDEDLEKDEEDELNPVFETTTYEDGDTEIQVITSEITHSDGEEHPVRKPVAVAPVSIEGAVKKPSIPISKKKPFKKARKGSSRPKLQNKRARRHTKINGKKRI